MPAYRVLTPDDPDWGAIRQRLLVTWAKTIFGYFLMGALIWAMLFWFGAHVHIQLGFSTLWLLVPIITWWFSADISLWLMKCQRAEPGDADGARLLRIVDRVYEKYRQRLKFKPPAYISDNDLPNAFATGPIHRKAVVAATRGLFNCGLTDEEIEGIFAHELAHVFNYDVAINSFLAVLSSVLMMIVEMVVRGLLGGLNWVRNLFGLKPQKTILPSIVSTILMYVVFWLVGQFTRLIQLFVVRSRESGADATGALFSGKPCELATALQKIVRFVEKNRPKGRDLEMYRALRPVMTIDPLYDTLDVEKDDGSIWSKLLKFWRYLQLTHPPVPERVAALEKMKGGPCPRI